MQKSISEGLGQILKGRYLFNWRWFAIIFSVIISIGLYITIINNIDPNSNLIRSFARVFQTPNYKFYSGGEKGVYFTIVSSVTAEINRQFSFEVSNIKTSGGSENALKVLTTPRSLGLVQEETIKKDDFIRKELNYITPLYIERMHIVLRLDKSNPYSKDFSYENPPVLTSNTEDEVLKLFANANISTGPVGSGSIVIASHILSEINNQIKEKGFSEEQNIYNLTMANGLKNITSTYSGKEKINILFNIAGSPIKDLKKILEDDQYMLIGVDPSFVSKLNLENGLNLRLTDFKHNHNGLSDGIYKKSKNVSAIGSYAWLISSKDIPNKDILNVLEVLRDNKEKIAENLGVENPSIEHSPLEEMNFYDSYKSKYNRNNIGEWKSILIFITALSISSVAVFSFLLYIFSFRKQSKYFHDIVAVLENAFPANTELDDNNYLVGEVPEDVDLPYRRPKVYEKQEVIINEIVKGIQGILKITKEINEDFQSGSITNNSYTFLMNSIEDTRQKLQKHLGRRLNEVIERNDGLMDVKIIDDLRIYYTAGYLLKEDYISLKKIILDPKT